VAFDATHPLVQSERTAAHYVRDPVAVLVDLQNVAVRRVDRILFEGLSLTVSDGDRIGIVGTNGAGKSTLLRILAGVDPPDEGQVRRGRGSRVGYLSQTPILPPGSVRGAVGEGWEAEAALDRLGMTASIDADIGSLSGGQEKRVALAQVLVNQSELLVLDEPTNHLDLGSVNWLEQQLLAFRGGLVLVTHDRHLLDRLTNRMVEIEGGRTFTHEGGYEAYLMAKAEREEQIATAESTRRNLARHELAWLRRGAKARSRKPQARIDAALKLMQVPEEAASNATALEISAVTPRLGNLVIECRDMSFRYQQAPLVVSGVDLVLDNRERLGLVGPNGSGKSTLLDLLARRIPPTSGSIEFGITVVIGYYDQLGVTLDPNARVQDLVAGPHRSAGSLADIDLMKRFQFTGELPYAKAGSLSGGERRRLQLLLVLASRPNVLLLDEPTNDLDLDTLRVLEDFLDEWPGALVVASHDRTFLTRTTERLVAIGRSASLSEVPGGVEGWISQIESASTRSSTAAPTAKPKLAHAKSARSSRAQSGSAVRSSARTGRQLFEAEKDLVRKQKQRDDIVSELADTEDYQEIRRLGQELDAAQSALDGAEETWLTLAEQAEDGR
jgi:ABC transport system ATP-binding/permease protein